MNIEQILASLVEREGHVVIRLVRGVTYEGWVTELSDGEIVFEHAPSPFHAQATGTDEWAPPPERIAFDDVAAWLDEDGRWHELRPLGPGPDPSR